MTASLSSRPSASLSSSGGCASHSPLRTAVVRPEQRKPTQVEIKRLFQELSDTDPLSSEEHHSIQPAPSEKSQPTRAPDLRVHGSSASPCALPSSQSSHFPVPRSSEDLELRKRLKEERMKRATEVWQRNLRGQKDKEHIAEPKGGDALPQAERIQPGSEVILEESSTGNEVSLLVRSSRPSPQGDAIRSTRVNFDPSILASDREQVSAYMKDGECPPTSCSTSSYPYPATSTASSSKHPTCPSSPQSDPAHDTDMQVDELVQTVLRLHAVRDTLTSFRALPESSHRLFVEKLSRAATFSSLDEPSQIAAYFFDCMRSRGLCSPAAFEDGFALAAAALDDAATTCPRAYERFAIMGDAAGL